jgi:DNA-directed RNA polymerase subunit RPC12/RpoP
MPILSENGSMSPAIRTPAAAQRPAWHRMVICMTALLLSLTGCKKDAGISALETDANGYVCLKCGAKFYTERTVFMGSKCPQCNQTALTETVGYYCEKDQHLTIRGREGDRQGAVCEKCQAHLANAMKEPREKDYKAWGATKTKG